MRRIFNMLVDLAAESQKAIITDPVQLNDRVRVLREAYNYLDNGLTNPRSADPVKVHEAMVVADFPLYFGQAISRAFMAEYSIPETSWRDYTYPDTVPDFRPVDRHRMTEMETLLKRAELAPAQRTDVAESKFQYSVDEYARSFAISWRVIVNDDLGEIQQFPKKLVRASTRFEDKFVTSLFDNATTKAALVALGTKYSQNLSLNVNDIKTAFSQWALRTDAQGNPLDIRPRFLVVHPTDELTAREILSGIDPTLTAPAVRRITAGLLELRTNVYLTTPGTFWLFADPNDVPAVPVARLSGYESATVYMKAPNMITVSSSGAGLGSPSWMNGNFDSGEIEFMVQNIIGGFDDPTYVGVTDPQGVFWAS